MKKKHFFYAFLFFLNKKQKNKRQKLRFHKLRQTSGCKVTNGFTYIHFILISIYLHKESKQFVK